MLDEVETCLSEIARNTHILLSGEVGMLNTDQRQGVETIQRVNDHMTANLLSLLSEMLKLYPSPYEAVNHMSHEWRTPITAMVGYSYLLLDGLFGTLDDRQVNILENIHECAERLKRWSSSP